MSGLSISFETYSAIVSKLVKKTKGKQQMMQLNDYCQNLSENYERLRFQLSTEEYRCEIAQTVKGKKTVCLLQPKDMIVAYYLKECLQETLEAKVHPNAFAYISGRSRFNAIDTIYKKMYALNMQEIIFADIHEFFNTISIDPLMEKLKSIGISQHFLCVLQKNIEVPIIDNGKVVLSRGLPLGHPLSPVLSNVYMYDFDEMMTRQYDLYIRYSDDIAIGNYNKSSKADLGLMNNALSKKGFGINVEKLAILEPGGKHKFLGQEITMIINENIEEKLVKYILGVETVVDESNMNEEQIISYIIAYNWVNKVVDFDVSKVMSTEIVEMLGKLAIEHTGLMDYVDSCIKVFVTAGLYAYGEIAEQFSKRIEKKQADYQYPVEVFHRLRDIGLLNYRFLTGSYLLNKRQFTFYEGRVDYEAIVNIECSGQSVAVELNEAVSSVVVIDVDIEKKVIENDNMTDVMLKQLLDQAKVYSKTIQEVLRNHKVESTLVYSGRRGFHIWIIFENNELLLKSQATIISAVNTVYKPRNITSEFLPLMTESSVIRIPCTIHEVTKERGMLLDDIERSFVINNCSMSTLNEEITPVIHQVDSINSLEDISPESKAVLENCQLIRRIVEKAFSINYLNHFERNALLYVFGQVKSDGRALLHHVISQCINYDEGITESFIDKIKDKPVSCKKLKMRFPELSQDCSCDFSEYKLYYPSPVIYGLIENEGNVTKPDYIDKVNRIKEIKILSETQRIETLYQLLSDKLQEKGKIEQEIKQCKKELEVIFKQNNLKSYNISAGKLTRVGENWVIVLG